MASQSRRNASRAPLLALLFAITLAVLLAAIAVDAVPKRPSIKKVSVKKTYLQANVW